MSTLDKALSWKNQPGDEIHKIFTVVGPPASAGAENLTDRSLGQTAEKFPVMKTFEYNWATAEIIKMYLRNSRAQEARKARMVVAEASVNTQETSTIDPGLATANNEPGAGSSNVDSDPDTSDDEPI